MAQGSGASASRRLPHALALAVAALFGAGSCPPASALDRADANDLPVVSPEDVGWSSEKLRAVDEEAARLGFAAIMLACDGKVFHAWGDTTRGFLCHSIRKPFLGALYGIHEAKGEIDLDATLQELGIDDIPPRLSSEEKAATVRQLLQSRSGIYHEAAAEAESMIEARPARGGHAPGTFFYYNNWDFNALGTIFRQCTGRDIFAAFEEEIAIPIGMQDFAATQCEYQWEPEKSIHPAYSFRMSARDMLRFGILFQQGGVWKGQEVVPAAWIEESTRTYSTEEESGGLGYGYLWKTIPSGSAIAQALGASGYFHTGVGIHALVILPELRLVAVVRFDTDTTWEDPGEAGEALPFLLMGARL